MSKKQGGMQRFLNFMAGKGFYVVLLLCIAAIGVSGYMLFFSTPDSGDNGGDLSLRNVTPSPTPAPLPTPTPKPTAPPPTPTEDNSLPQGGVLETPEPDPTPTPDKSVAGPADIPDETEPPAEVTPPPAETKSSVEFFWPVQGSVLGAYTGSAMAFSETMQDWRVHPGIDIESGPGAVAMAAADGTVTEIKNDPHYGTVITITHADGYVTKYGNLKKEVNVEPEQAIKSGHILGSIGDTAAVESVMQEHLHFEILKDGKQINPLELLSAEE